MMLLDPSSKYLLPLRRCFLVSTLLVSFACSAKSTGGEGSDTNWLAQCDSDDDCRNDGAECLCGRCTVTCDTTSDCARVSGLALCIDRSEDDSCTSLPNSNVCAIECEEDDDCPASAPACLGGSCGAVTTSGGVDADDATSADAAVREADSGVAGAMGVNVDIEGRGGASSGEGDADDDGATLGGSSGVGGSSSGAAGQSNPDDAMPEPDCGSVGEWVTMATENAPTPTERRNTFWTGEEMIVIAYDITVPLDAGRYEPCANRWEPVSIEGMPQQVYYSSAGSLPPPIVANRRLFFLYPGIWTNPSPLESTTSAIVYDIDADTWTELPLEGAPAPAASRAVVSLGSHIFMWGGMTEPPQGSPGVLTNAGGVLDTETLTWTPIDTSGAPSARALAAATVIGNRVAVWGGALDTTAMSQCPRGGECNLAADGAIYDLATDQWVSIPASSAPTPRKFATLYGVDDALVVWGGQDVGFLEDGGVYSPATQSWNPILVALDTLGDDDSSNLSVRLAPPYMVLLGPSATGIYDPRTNSMTLADSTNRAPVVGGATLRANGEVTYAVNEPGVEGSFWRTNAELARWETAPLPAERQPLLNSDTVWTGTRFIAWGGYTESFDPNAPTGCENAPPDVGCDPVLMLRRDYENTGAHLIPAWR